MPRSISYSILVSFLLLLLCATASSAQSRYETPTGHQTVAPSQMPQQPLSTGVSPGGKAPGAIAQATALVLPQGDASTVRVGPVEATPMWVRLILAVWLLLQIGAAIAAGVMMSIGGHRDYRRFQHGHEVDVGHKAAMLPKSH